MQKKIVKRFLKITLIGFKRALHHLKSLICDCLEPLMRVIKVFLLTRPLWNWTFCMKNHLLVQKFCTCEEFIFLSPDLICPNITITQLRACCACSWVTLQQSYKIKIEGEELAILETVYMGLAFVMHEKWSPLHLNTDVVTGKRVLARD